MFPNRCKLAFAIFFLASSTAFGTVYRVDTNSTATFPDGSTWALAYKYLQDALAEELADGDEIWVSGGVTGAEKIYYPDKGSGRSEDSQSETFQLPLVAGANDDGVLILGGFAGTETSSSERNPNKYITILSGDIDDNNGTHDDANSLHVVTGTGVDDESIIVLDGFTITQGWADGGTDEGDSGGGVLVFESSYANGNPRIQNCIIKDNHADAVGGGALFLRAKGAFINCIFQDNDANQWGGGLYVAGGFTSPDDSTTDVINCQFINNTAYEYGGGMQIANSSPKVTNCMFYDNSVN